MTHHPKGNAYTIDETGVDTGSRVNGPQRLTEKVKCEHFLDYHGTTFLECSFLRSRAKRSGQQKYR